MTVHLTAEAESGLEAIGDYITQDNPVRAVPTTKSRLPLTSISQPALAPPVAARIALWNRLAC